MPSTTGPKLGDKVSIIIPCYKQAHFLAEAIESALAQDYDNFEVIVVNDGSPDNTSEVAKRYPVSLIEQENKGLSAARNAGIKASTGSWILPLDADNKLAPDFLSKTVGKDDIVGSWQQHFGTSDYLFKPISPTIQELLSYNRLDAGSLYRKIIWETIGGYDENMRDGWEDWDFWIRAVVAGFTISIVEEPIFFYRKHEVSMASDAASKGEQIITYMFNKYKNYGLTR